MYIRISALEKLYDNPGYDCNGYDPSELNSAETVSGNYLYRLRRGHAAFQPEVSQGLY